MKIEKMRRLSQILNHLDRLSKIKGQWQLWNVLIVCVRPIFLFPLLLLHLFFFFFFFFFFSSLPQYSSDEALSWSTAVKTRLTSCWQGAESGAEAQKTVEMDLSMPLVISFNIIKSFYSFRSSREAWPGMTNAVERLQSPLSVALPGELPAVCPAAAAAAAAAAKQGHLTAFNCSCPSPDARKNVLAPLWTMEKWVLVSLVPTAGETWRYRETTPCKSWHGADIFI